MGSKNLRCTSTSRELNHFFKILFKSDLPYFPNISIKQHHSHLLSSSFDLFLNKIISIFLWI